MKFLDISYDPKYNDDEGIDPITAGQNPSNKNGDNGIEDGCCQYTRV